MRSIRGEGETLFKDEGAPDSDILTLGKTITYANEGGQTRVCR
jgi:hypothetical protein